MKFTKFIKFVFDTVSPDSKYTHNWHIKVMADRLQAALAGKINRLIINIPPRSMKSICVSVAWPAWIIGLNPSARIIVASYSQILSEKLSLDTRLVLESQWYKEAFPEVKILKAQNTKRKFITTKLGFRFATSVGGSLTGEGGNFLILDDPMNPLQASSLSYRKKVFDWFNQSFITRLNDRKRGIVIVVMHRLHTDDLTGMILSSPTSKNWNILSIPFLSERNSTFFSSLTSRSVSSRLVLYERYKHEPLSKRYSAKYVERLKKEVGTNVFCTQYQQRPINTMNGGIIKQKWFRRYHPGELKDSGATIVQSWDTASSTRGHSDFSVCSTWAILGKHFYLLDVFREKFAYSALKQAVHSLHGRWGPSVILIEERASGHQLIQEMEGILPILAHKLSHSKLTRVLCALPTIQSGRIYLPFYAQWLYDFEYEICAFPNTTHDDQVDSMTQLLMWSEQYVSECIGIREI